MTDEILLSITRVTDDSTGCYTVGELDFGIHGACMDYIKDKENRKKLADWLEMLSKRCRNNEIPLGTNNPFRKDDESAVGKEG